MIEIDQGLYSDDGDNGAFAPLESATTSLDHLEIREGSLEMTELTNVLRASKKLKTIVYEADWSSYITYSTPDIRQALTWSQDILENFWLDLWDGQEFYPLDGHLTPMGSLSTFTVLKNLWVGMHVFFGTELRDRRYAPDLASLLPTSIETLYFSHPEPRLNRFTSTLEKLLQTKESHTPKLRMIAFEAEITRDEQNFDYSRLDFLAKASGVEIAKINHTMKRRSREKDRTLNVSSLFDSCLHL